MALNNRERVARGFERLAEALDEFIETTVAFGVPDGKNWTVLLTARDQAKGITGKSYERGDVQAQLRMLTENITGQVQPGWFPFDDKLSRPAKSLASELRETRDSWAHMKAFSTDDTYRALDSTERLLRAIGAAVDADAVRDERLDLRRLATEAQDRKVVAVASVESTGLKPWREVLQPHPDVASGNFQAAEFAANLQRVATGVTTGGEYGDPELFFARTFLTEGLADLLSGAVRRVGGDLNASGVVNLQTTFGGGKTHSMLSLWHLFSGVQLSALPQGVQDLVSDRGLPTGVARAALVGTYLKAGSPTTKPDGTVVNTVWGELAWQLGAARGDGAAGYAHVADADRTRTNPGEALPDLLAAYSPAVVLIDEWVAYARQLVGRDDDQLVGGTFETHFTFAQTLSEAAATTPGILLVISIPASPDSDGQTSSGVDEEVGGADGQQALRVLQNAVRRVASQWRPASADEAFEIVKQRLFDRPTPEALAHIGATATQFVEFYRKHAGEFPAEARDNAYVERIRRSYPVHPELFDRLYADWSTLDKFQRTRGVLKLMNEVVGALWQSGDSAPLILPGTVPLATDKVLTEITQYVEDGWKSIVDNDVDGPQSVPKQVDEANKALLGSRMVTQRLARTIFLGATPTLKTAQKGLDRTRVFLGTAVPGDVPGNFYSALTQLSDRATYLYSAGARYWYDTQANASRAARDEAERVHPEEVSAEVVRRLVAQRGRGAVTPVHVTADPTDVPDAGQFRLVVLPPEHPFDRKLPRDSAASAAVQRLVDLRAGGARHSRNQLAVLALDAARAGDLERAVRDYLGWKHVAAAAEDLGLNQTQGKQAADRAAQADETVRQRLVDGYTALLAPTSEPGQPWTLATLRADKSATSVLDRALARLAAESWLAETLSPRVIRMDLEKMPDAWKAGHIDIAALWDLHVQHPYLSRMSDRDVLERGVADALNDTLGWDAATFALAAAVDPSGGRYVDLRLPGDSAPFTVTGTTLLVQPARALAQRADDERRAAESTVTSGGGSSSGGMTSGEGYRDPVEKPSVKSAVTRFFGSRTLDPLKFGKDLMAINDEVLQRLVDAGAELEISIEIHATKTDGFDEAVVRTVSENASVLNFDPSGFEQT